MPSPARSRQDGYFSRNRARASAPAAAGTPRGLPVGTAPPARAQPLVDAGARLAATPAEAARGADAVVMMLSDPIAVQTVVAGPDGILATLARDALVIDMSTVDVA